MEKHEKGKKEYPSFFLKKHLALFFPENSCILPFTETYIYILIPQRQILSYFRICISFIFHSYDHFDLIFTQNKMGLIVVFYLTGFSIEKLRIYIIYISINLSVQLKVSGYISFFSLYNELLVL